MSNQTSSVKKRPWVEPVVAVLMAVTTLSTAWCSYQSSRWAARGAALARQADRLERKANALHAEGTIVMAAHATQVMNLIDAELSENKKVADFYSIRLGPELRKAYDAWMVQKPFENPNAPPHPLVPELYQPRFRVEAEQTREESARLSGEVTDYARNGSAYLANTVLFATVLFFAGTAGRFEHRRIRQASLVFAIAVFLFAATRVISLPVVF